MKRREFFAKIYQFLPFALFGSGFFHFFPLNKNKAFNNKKVTKNVSKKQVLNTFELPENPIAYHSIYELKVTEKDLPLTISYKKNNLQGNNEDFQIKEEGSYTFQYLGDYYGWSII